MVYDTDTSQEPVGRGKEHISCFDIKKKKQLIRFWRAKESNFKNEKEEKIRKKTQRLHSWEWLWGGANTYEAWDTKEELGVRHRSLADGPQNWASDFRRKDTAWLLQRRAKRLILGRWSKKKKEQKVCNQKRAGVAARVNCPCWGTMIEDQQKQSVSSAASQPLSSAPCWPSRKAAGRAPTPESQSWSGAGR